MNKFSKILMAAGFIILNCTCGASDGNLIGFKQLCLQLVIGLVLMALGAGVRRENADEI